MHTCTWRSSARTPGCDWPCGGSSSIALCASKPMVRSANPQSAIMTECPWGQKRPEVRAPTQRTSAGAPRPVAGSPGPRTSAPAPHITHKSSSVSHCMADAGPPLTDMHPCAARPGAHLRELVVRRGQQQRPVVLVLRAEQRLHLGQRQQLLLQLQQAPGVGALAQRRLGRQLLLLGPQAAGRRVRQQLRELAAHQGRKVLLLLLRWWWWRRCAVGCRGLCVQRSLGLAAWWRGSCVGEAAVEHASWWRVLGERPDVPAGHLRAGWRRPAALTAC